MAERIQVIAGHLASTAADTGSLLASHSKEIATQHPLASTIVGTGAVLVAGPWLLTAPVMTMAGFSSSGIVSGSLAATVHSAIGNVAAGSAFAVLQSAGTGGPGLVIINSAVQGAGIGVSAGGALMGYFTSQSSEKEGAEKSGNEGGEGAKQEL